MKLSLNGEWRLAFRMPGAKQVTEMAAQVPGNVVGDLTRAGIVLEPYYGTNTNLLRPFEFVDWTFRKNFRGPAVAPGERLELLLEGVDTIAEIFINGQSAGKTANMFIEHRFDITELVRREEENEITVAVVSSVNYARQFKRPSFTTALPYNYEGLFLRRPMHSYGWDIAPRVVGAGLWRGVSIETVKPDRWDELYLYTHQADAKDARLILDWSFATAAETLDGFTARLTLRSGDSVLEKEFVPRFVTGSLDFHLPKPRLWWPLGSGEQPLYEVTLELFREGKKLDTRVWETGIRDLHLIRTEELADDGSGEFKFTVNGETIFIKGSNWVPADMTHGERPERIVQGLELFKDLGCNMVRCWGGGVYEDHDFYDYCDRNGLLVWQDFMFACEMPPADEWFLAEVRREAEAVIRKLRRHPSIAIWSGDNECDEFAFYRPANMRRPPSANRITREVLKEMVNVHDPARDYLPSSPYLADSLWRRNTRYNSPEQHLWGPRDNWKSPFYKDNNAIFASEIGYHGMPCEKSIRKFIPEASLNGRIGNPDWLCHASQPFNDLEGPYSYRIKLMLDQVEGFFGEIPADLDGFIRSSQIVQAEAFKFFIENFRMKKGRKTGLIWWNVIDGWPQFSDAVVDYYYEKKLAYTYIKRAQQSLSLMFSEPDAWCLTLHAVNDRPRPVAGTFRVTDLDTGKLEMEGEFTVPANGGGVVDRLRVCQGHQRMLLIEWECEGENMANHYLLGTSPVSRTKYDGWLEKIGKLPL